MVTAAFFWAKRGAPGGGALVALSLALGVGSDSFRQLMFAGPARAETVAAESLARDMAHDMPSPYCPGRSIASCPSGMARELEDDILEAALKGQSREEIEASLVARFGREKMGYEQSTSVFVIVTLVALAAVVLIVRAGRRWATKASDAAGANVGPKATHASISQDELDELEDDLDALDGI